MRIHLRLSPQPESVDQFFAATVNAKRVFLKIRASRQLNISLKDFKSMHGISNTHNLRMNLPCIGRFVSGCPVWLFVCSLFQLIPVAEAGFKTQRWTKSIPFKTVSFSHLWSLKLTLSHCTRYPWLVTCCFFVNLQIIIFCCFFTFA